MIGPLIPFGLSFIIGAYFGSQVKRVDHPATIIIVGLVLALMLGPFPFYDGIKNMLGIEVSGVYISALIGILLGSKAGKHKR